MSCKNWQCECGMMSVYYVDHCEKCGKERPDDGEEELSRKQLGPINREDVATPLDFDDGDGQGDFSNRKECMYEEIDRLTNRHIAKCLDHLGETIAPVQKASIKRSFRFFAEDIKHVTNGEQHGNEDKSRGNR